MSRLMGIGSGSILADYRGVICDLDGVVYRGTRGVPGAADTILGAVRAGRRVAFATNNASRTADEVMAHLEQLGIAIPEAASGATTVVTSAQAAAAHVRARFPAASSVLAVGGNGVVRALHAAGLTPVRTPPTGERVHAVAVVQGAGPDVNWRDLAEVAFQVQEGALWVATNQDQTIPTGRGLAPGNGAMVAAVQGAVEVAPEVVGKPFRPLYELAMDWIGLDAAELVVVGDRLDMDIAGAVGLGIDSLFVLGGVHRLADLVHCEPSLRPTYVGVDLRALLVPRQTPGSLDSLVRAAWGELDHGRDPASPGHSWDHVEDRVRAEWAATWQESGPP